MKTIKQYKELLKERDKFDKGLYKIIDDLRDEVEKRVNQIIRLQKENNKLGQEVNDLKDNINLICEENKKKIKELEK